MSRVLRLILPTNGSSQALTRRGMWQRLVEFDRAWLYPHRFDTTSILSLVMLLGFLHELPVVRGWRLITIVAPAALVIPAFRKSVYPWAIIAVWLLFVNVVGGLDYWIPNHNYMIAYWFVALTMATLAPHSAAVLRINARLMIGLCFLLATMWKIISPDFADGTFFHFMLLTDARFAGVAELVGGVAQSDLLANAQAVSDLASSASPQAATVLVDTQRVSLMAQAISVWSIGLEALIAATFLCPLRWWPSRLSLAALLVFVLTTYPIATVETFAQLLVVMAFASCRRNQTWARLTYLAVFILSPLFGAPWASLLRPALAVFHLTGLQAEARTPTL